MGIDLWIIGNHKINFEGKSYEELSKEVKERLDKIVFPNSGFLRHHALYNNSNYPGVIREIYTKKEWTYEDDPFPFVFEEDNFVEFMGPHNLEITVYQHKIFIANGRYRYYYWFGDLYQRERDEWRKYFHTIVTALGGDRVLYLPDNLHHLAEYDTLECSFAEMEEIMLCNEGKPCLTFSEMSIDVEESYMIDYFTDIDWDNEYIPNCFTVVDRDKCSIDYNLNELNSKEKIQEIEFPSKRLLHKKIYDIIMFYHIEIVEGLLVIHTGELGKSENIELKLDEYAQLIFEDMIMRWNLKGYTSKLMQTHKLYYDGNINAQEELKKISRELIWSGYGEYKFDFDYENNKFRIRINLLEPEYYLQKVLDALEKYSDNKSVRLTKLKDGKQITVFEKRY